MFMPSACGIFLFFSLNFIALNDILIDLYFICTDSSMIEIGKDFQSNAHAFHYITSYLYSLFRYFAILTRVSHFDLTLFHVRGSTLQVQ